MGTFSKSACALAVVMLAIPVLVSNFVAQTFILDFAQVSKTVEELTDASLVIANVTVQSAAILPLPTGRALYCFSDSTDKWADTS